MKRQRNKMICFLILSLGISTTSHADGLPAEQALDGCMQRTMAVGAILGAAGGAILGALFGGRNKAKVAAIGAGLGAAAGGAIAWQKSLKSCSQSLNLVSLNSIQTVDYKNTIARYNYTGPDPLLRIEDGSVTTPVNAGQTLYSNLKFALLNSDGLETEVKIDRVYKCGNTEIPIQQEKFKVIPGTIESKGEIPIPSLSTAIGEQQCDMKVVISALDQQQEFNSGFVIVPNKP